MSALTDNITRSSLVSSWAQGRRRITPRVYPYLRAVGIIRLAAGAFVLVVGALLISHGHPALAAIPLVGAAVLFAIGGLDLSAGISAHSRR